MEPEQERKDTVNRMGDATYFIRAGPSHKPLEFVVSITTESFP